MSDDIVKRLRGWPAVIKANVLMCEAADRITTLEAQLEKAKEALRPFSEEAPWWFVRNYNSSDVPVENFDDYKPVMTCGDLFRARATLAELEGRE